MSNVCEEEKLKARCFGECSDGEIPPRYIRTTHVDALFRCISSGALQPYRILLLYAGSQGSQVVARCSTGTSRMANMAGMHVRVHGPLGGLPRVQLSGVRDALRCVDTDSRFGLRASPACC